MKKTSNIFLRGFFLFLFAAGVLSLQAQVPAYRCELRNDSLLTSQVYEFEIWLKNTGTIPFELGNFQAGIMLNSLILDGGNINASIISGSSQLNDSQQPSAIIFFPQDNCLKIAPKSPPAFSGGTVISGAGEGTRICRIRLTNSIPFGTAKPNLSFNFSVFPYNTVVSAFDRTTHMNVNITAPGSHLLAGLANPLLNGPVTVFSVTGSGSYCQGSPGLPVSLSNSETEIMYQLKKNGISDGGEISGSGTALIWTGRTEGTYTIQGRRPSTYLSGEMTGAAVIVGDEPTAGGNINGGTTISLGSTTDTLRLLGQSGDVLTWQKRVDISGFADIPSTAGLTSFMETPSTAGSWEYRAVVKSGSCLQEFSTPAVVVVSSEPITRSWSGLVDEKWNKAGNWSPAGVPGMTDDVIIPATAPNMPVVLVNGLGCDDVLVKAGASLIIQPGFILTVNGTMIIEE